MSGDPFAPGDAVLRDLLESRPLIALVGASTRPDRPSHEVMRALLEHGHDIVPVNPREREVLGRPCYPDLRSIPRRVQLVDVFRRAEATPDIARQAVEAGARALWLQVGIVSAEAATIARTAGLIVVMDRCTWVEHQRLIGSVLPHGASGAADDPVGLCRDCRHSRQVPAVRATYWMCRRSATDSSFPKYPPLPVRNCRGFEWKTGDPSEAEPA